MDDRKAGTKDYAVLGQGRGIAGVNSATIQRSQTIVALLLCII